MADYAILGVRLGQIITLIVAITTLAVGAKRCNWFFSYTCDKNDISYGSWSEYNKGGRMAGQYFIFYTSLIFVVISAALFALELLHYRLTKLLTFIICGAATLIMFINFCVEIYYASGSAIQWMAGEDKVVRTTSRSWIATCVFLFVAMLFYAIDVVLAKRMPKPIRTVIVNA